MNQEDVLTELRDAEALLDGHFELRSGLHSNQFFQCALLTRFPDKAERLCQELVRRMRDELGDIKPDGVIAPAVGGIVVGHEMARALGVPSIFAEKTPADDLELRRGFKIQPGESYVVAEDVVTRGGRVQQTIEVVESHGASVAAVLVLVDRSGGKASFSSPHLSLLQMEPVVHEPSDCPMCQEGTKAEHPGS